jgi:hypothetical protein
MIFVYNLVFILWKTPITFARTGFNMKINCPDMKTFIEVVAGLVREGLSFKADAGTLVVWLTGGH